MIVGFIRLAIYAFIAYIIYKFIQAVLAPAPTRPRDKRKEGEPGVMVKDEVCHTYLAKEDAIRLTVDGREVYFCSQECRRKFEERRKESA